MHVIRTESKLKGLHRIETTKTTPLTAVVDRGRGSVNGDGATHRTGVVNEQAVVGG